jgi:hypothetical protein
MSANLKILGQALVPLDTEVLLYQVPPSVDPVTGNVSSKGKITQTLVSQINVNGVAAGAYSLWMVPDHPWGDPVPAWSAEYSILTLVTTTLWELDVFHIGMTLPGDFSDGTDNLARTPALFFSNWVVSNTYSVVILGTEMIRNE